MLFPFAADRVRDKLLKGVAEFRKTPFDLLPLDLHDLAFIDQAFTRGHQRRYVRGSEADEASIEAMRHFCRELYDRLGISIGGQVDDNRFVGHAAPRQNTECLVHLRGRRTNRLDTDQNRRRGSLEGAEMGAT